MKRVVHSTLAMAYVLLLLMILSEVSYAAEQGLEGWMLAGKVATAAALVCLLAYTAPRLGIG